MTYDEWLKKKEEQARSGSNATKSKPAGYDEWKASKAGPSAIKTEGSTGRGTSPVNSAGSAKPAGYDAWKASKTATTPERQRYAFPGFNSELVRKADPGFDDRNRWYRYHGKSYSELSSMLADMEEGDERDWLNNYASAVAYNEKSNFDTKAGAQEIAQLESVLADYRNLTRWSTDEKGEARAAAILRQYGSEDEILALIQQKRQYLDESQRIQNGIALAGVADPSSEHYDPEFAAYSGYSSTKLDDLWEKMWSRYNMGYGDLTYEYINNQDGIRDKIRSESRAYDRYTQSSFEGNHYDYMTADEVSIYNYYYSKHGKEKAEEYLEAIGPTLEQRSNIELVENVSRYAGEHPVAASALSVGTSLLSGQEYLKDLVEYGVDKALGKTARFGTNEAALMTNAARGSVSELVDWEIGNWDAFDFLYSTAMSGADSMVGGLAFGNMGGAVLGLSAAAQGTNDALARGMSSGQAFWNGLFSGAFECIFESVSIGNFNRLKEVAPDSIKDVFKNIGKSMLVNASEETLTEIANIAYDTLINGEFANYTREELENGAWKDALLQVIEAGASGALMGVGMGGISSIAGYVNRGERAEERVQDTGRGGADPIQPVASDMPTDITEEYTAPVNVEESFPDFDEVMPASEEYMGYEETPDSFTPPDAEGEEYDRSDISSYEETGELDGDWEFSDDWWDDLAQLDEEVERVFNSPKRRLKREIRRRTKGLRNLFKQTDNNAETDEADEISTATIRDNQNVETVRENRTVADNATVQESLQVARESLAAEEAPAEGHYESSAEGKTILKSSGETVTIKEIASIKDGKMTLKLDDGRTVDASDVSYSSQDEALVYEAVADMGTNAVAADLLVKAFAPGGISAQDYVHGIKEAYTYGQYNFPMKEVANGPFASMLSDEQRNTAYKLGQIFSGKQVAKEQATVRGNRTVAKKATTDHSANTGKKAGKVHFDRKGRTFDDVREVSLKTMEQLSAALGVEFYVFESYVNESGHRVYKTENGKEVAAPNGFYDPKDGSIHIDLNAGRDGKGTMLFTVAHELTHFIHQWSPAKFKVLANFLNQQYGEKSKSVSALVDEQIAKAKRNGRTISYAVAYEEVVADSMESMLTDGNVVQMMSDLAQQDKSLWQKICDWFKDLVSDLKAIVDAYTGKNPDSIEGKLVADMQDVIIILESLYADALVDASENRWADPKAEKNTTQEGGAKFQTRNVNGDQVVWIEANILKENKGLPVHQFVANYIAEHIGEVYTIIESGQKVYIGQDLPGEYTQSKYTKAILRNNPNIARAKNRASANLGEMIEIATNRRWEKTKHHGSKDAKYGMYRYDTRFGFPVKDTSGRVTGANIFRAELLIRNASDGKKYLYDIVSIKKDTASSDWLTQRVTSAAEKTAGQKGVVFKDNVAQKTTEVNKKFSSRDSNGNTLTAEQQEYFKDSKVRDEQGRLLVMYHGTPSGKHTTFRSGTYFTPDRQYADVYQSPGASALSVKREKDAPKTFEVYLNITKPFDTRNDTEREIFMQEYYRQWGTGAPLSDSGLPDWTDGMDLQEFIEEMGYDYDGLILDEGATGGYGMEVKSRGLSYVTFSSNQVKNVDNVTPTSDPDIRYSDRDYLDAVNRGDMRAAQRMVDEAAERWGAYLNNDEANEVFHQDGRIRTFYHGTNTGDFTTFDRGLLGSSSGDLGWFGKGFYFAFSYDEAATYGGRVIPAYLRMRKPFDYSQLYKFKGSDKGSSRYSRFAWVYNITKQFPDLAEGQRVWAYPNDAEEGTAVSWKQLAGWMDRVHKEKQFSVEEVEQSDGTTAWELRADPKKKSFTTDDGETFEWIEYGMRKLFATEQDAREPLNQVCAYLENMMGVESVPRRAIERIDFSGAVQRAGYDGILQSMSGDEAVVFSPEQIKTSEPVTYDDNGNVIPLSKRFGSGNPDIRYSDRDPEQQRINRVLEKENAKLREDVTYLKELLKLQRSVTGGKKFTRTSVQAAATKLMKDASARGQKAELVGLLNGFYEYIAGGEELTWEGVVEQAQPVVQWLMAHESTKKQTNEYAADILRELRGTRISLDDLQKKEVAYQYGSFNEFRKKTMGSIIVTNSGTPLDVQWIELSRQYPHIFNPETTSNDMPSALLDAISNLRSMPADDAFGYDGEMAAMDLLHQVYDSYWSVSTLYTVADVKQREINRLKSAHHQRMADLRETHRENTAKLKQQHSKDLERVRTEMRKAANARMEKTVQKYQESRQRGIESRNKTAMRQKIKRVVSDLNQYLLNGTKDRHVPIELQKAVAEALDAVNMDSVGADERLAKLQAEMVRAKTPQKVAEIAKKFDHVRDMDDRMQARLKALHDAYEEIKNDEDPLMSNVYDDGLSAHMMTLMVEVGDTPLREMSMYQLECVYDVYQIVLTTIRNANKAFKTAKSESIASMGNMAMMEVRGIGGKKRYGMKGMDAIKEFGWNNLKPVYAFEHIGSNTLTKLFNNVRAGEDVWAVDVTEAREYYLDKAKRYKYNSWDFAKQHTFKSTSGMDFSLNLEQIMSLYAYSKRDQAADHLRRGGIVIDETTEVTMRTKLGIPVKFNPTEATAYNISDMTLAEIVGTLTPEQKGFVDEMQDYLSTVMGGKGNEVSLAMYGIKLFKEKFYFPLKSAPQFMAKAKEQQHGEVKIKNAGFSKQTVKKASNPIVLTPFMNVWADHVNEMSMYHAFVLPMEDFYRVYNFKTPTSEGTATQSVEMTIQNAYGKGATKYIDQLLKDLNGGARTDSTTGIINKGIALFKKGAVFASLSVVIQQPSAIARATALIDTKYFIGPKVDHKKHKALWEELKLYAPVAIIKEMGYFDTNMGKSTQDFILGKEYSGFDEKMKALVTDSNYRDEILSKAPALADELAWCSIWEAVKRETVAKNPGMAANSDEFLQKAGQRFTEVITKTQVYDSVLSRSALMRSKDTGMKMATAFMAEPTTSINMVADALLKGKRGNRKYARGAIGAVIASNILNSILVSFVYAGRDDDEDKTYAEKYIGTLAGEVLDSLNPATYIPFIKDIVSIVQGYDVERSDMAVISDLWNAWKKLSSGNLSAWQKVEGFAGSIAQIFGLPVKNIMRDVRGIYQTIQSFMSGQKTTGAGIGYAVKSAITGQDTSNKQQLYEAYLSGDKAQISRVESRFKDQSAINTAIRTALRENDSRIHAAAVARTNGNLNEYTRLAKEIIAEGHFSQDNVVAAINAEINAMKKGDTTSASKALGLYKVEDFTAAVSGGDSAMADAVRDDIIQTAQKNGKTADEAEKSFISSAKTATKELFLSSGITETQAINALVSYCGETGDEAKQRVSEWAFEAEFGFAYGEKVQKFKDGEISAAELKGVLIDVDGKTDDEAAASIVSYSRDGYEEGFFSRDETAELMMQYGGLTRSEAEAKLRYIDFKIANPDVYADDAWIDEYYKEVQSSGISIDLFVEYRNRVKSMTGSNKKAQRMAVIDSLPISNDQKDALYYAEGWASSKLYEAPWR